MYTGGLYGYPHYHQGPEEPPPPSIRRQGRSSTCATVGEAKKVARSLERKMSLSSAPVELGELFDPVSPSVSISSV